MADVYLAREAAASRLVVVKCILPHLAGEPAFVRMFLQEARLAARLSHPGIATVIDVGAAGGRFYMAMEYVHGCDLRHVVRQCRAKGRVLEPGLVLRLVHDACLALAYAHAVCDADGRPLQLVHRDISPHNLLLTFEGQVKLIDFGIAKAADNWHRTRTGIIKGKYAYMSPEQARGQPLDKRSDLFAVGVVLHELLTGRRLFRRPTDAATLQAVMSGDIPAPSALVPSLPAELDVCVLQLLQRDPDQRPADAAQVAHMLAQLQKHMPVSAGGTPRRFMRELFADRLAEEARLGRPLYEPLAETPSSPPSPANASAVPLPAAIVSAPPATEQTPAFAPFPPQLSEDARRAVRRLVTRARWRRRANAVVTGLVVAVAVVLAALAVRRLSQGRLKAPGAAVPHLKSPAAKGQ